MGYRVVAPLVYLKVPDVAGSLVSYAFYAGAPVPASVDEASLKHHLDSGLVVSDSDPVAGLLGPAGTPVPGEPPNVAVQDSIVGESFEERADRLRASVEEKPAPKSKRS